MALVLSAIATVLLVQSVAWLGDEGVAPRQRSVAIAVAPVALVGAVGGLARSLMVWLGVS
ncbi:MAG: hypothetical protein ACPHRO_04455 [Nannocystaceae bacterium]